MPTQTVLSEYQQQLLQDKAREWKEDPTFSEEAERRRDVAREFQTLIRETGVLDQSDLTRAHLAEMIRLQKQVQNLSPMVLPRLLGTYHYYRFFKDFEGDEAAFVRHMQQKRSDWGETDTGYPGADLQSLSRDLAAALTSEGPGFAQALVSMMGHKGLGRAFATGATLLYSPADHPLVNSAAVGPFKEKRGDLYLDGGQRAALWKRAEILFGFSRKEISHHHLFTLGWISHLRDVRELCGFESHLDLDSCMWRLNKETRRRQLSQVSDRSDDYAVKEASPDDIDEYLATVDPKRKEARASTESKARAIIAANLGHLREEHLREVFRLLNQDFHNGKIYHSRFSPAFVGKNLNSIIAVRDRTNLWIERLWRCKDEEIETTLDQFWQSDDIPGSGISFPTGILYLRDPDRFNVYSPAPARGLARITGKKRLRSRSGKAYLAYNRLIQELKISASIPSQLVDLVLSTWSRRSVPTSDGAPLEAESVKSSLQFKGFTDETFRFLAGIRDNNNQTWFDERRDTYRDEVKNPLRDLVTDLGTTFFDRISADIETTPKSPKTLSRLRKNIYGRKEENVFNDYMWAAFHRTDRNKSQDFQLFLFVHPGYFACGLYVSDVPEDEKRRFLSRLLEHREANEKLLRQLPDLGIQIGEEQEHGEFLALKPSTLDEWVDLWKKKQLSIRRMIGAPDAALRGPALREDAERTFEALYPLYVQATAEDPGEEIARYLEALGGIEDETDEVEEEESAYSQERLTEDTGLDSARIANLEGLILDKRQIIFYGPPGTGKTYVAERVARYLAGTGGEIVTIQFHPSYSYEDFVEGIRPTVNPDTRQVEYRVQPGIFRRFCEKARAAPQHRFVLVIDEINRGNLPRIFGELLYLLERRDTPVDLPVSGKLFKVPKNIVIVGTMNTADQSIALLDTALRRRFHFERFDPDPELLRGWLESNQPEMGWVADLLIELNRRLEQMGIDTNQLVGHSHFMQSGLDEDLVERVWNHSIFPTIEEYFYGQGEKIEAFRYEEFGDRVYSATEDEDDLDAVED